MDVCILTNNDEIICAKQLVYETYVNNQNWVPPIDNPSGFRVEVVNNIKILTDDLESQSKWIGVYNDSSELVACCRVITPHMGNLEYNRYKKIFSYELNNKKNVEFNRLAIKSGFETTSAIPLLIKEVVNYTLANSYDGILTTLSFPEPGQFALKLGFKVIDNSEFKYSNSDLKTVSLFYFDVKEKLNLEKLDNIFSNISAA